MKSLIKNIKTYANDIRLGKWGWIKVLFDAAVSYLVYGFNNEDYFVIGNGYTLSKYEKKRWFTCKRAVWLQNKVNNPEYIHLLENKAEALNLFKDLVSRNWLYAPQASFEEFIKFTKETPVFIAKPVDGMCGKGIEKYSMNENDTNDLEVLYNQFIMGGGCYWRSV